MRNLKMILIKSTLIFFSTIFIVESLSSFFPAKIPDPVVIEQRTSEHLPGMCDTIPFMEGEDVYAGRSETAKDCEYNSLGLPIQRVERQPLKNHESIYSGETFDNGQIQNLESLPHYRIY